MTVPNYLWPSKSIGIGQIQFARSQKSYFVAQSCHFFQLGAQKSENYVDLIGKIIGNSINENEARSQIIFCLYLDILL
jgi:hypothetical protein